jgi:NAD(P)-dependent dehydrogenase (short-subunit alcohol dehydrogenase family)
MNNNPFSLSGKTIIVTGSSSGLGRQCAIACSQMGAIIVLLGRNEMKLEETLKLTTETARHFIYAVDLTDYEKVEKITREIFSKTGRIDGLINCAGISTTLPLNSISPQKMEQFFHTNVISAVNLTRQVAKPANFSESGGSIIFISSVMGVVGENGKTLYSMTKGALISAVRSLSVELAIRKIRVNAVSPGVVDTAMSKNAVYSRNEESLNKVKAMHPLGLGQPEDVANTCIFLLSDAAKWITGTNLIVDGGYLAR